MVIVLIRTQLRADADRAAYDALDEKMFALVQTMPGFLGAHGYGSAETGAISVIRFASQDALRAWRDHPDHVVAQQRGKADFYASYTIEVCDVVRAYQFP